MKAVLSVRQKVEGPHNLAEAAAGHTVAEVADHTVGGGPGHNLAGVEADHKVVVEEVVHTAAAVEHNLPEERHIDRAVELHTDPEEELHTGREAVLRSHLEEAAVDRTALGAADSLAVADNLGSTWVVDSILLAVVVDTVRSPD